MAFYRFIELEHWARSHCVKMQHNNKSLADTQIYLWRCNSAVIHTDSFPFEIFNFKKWSKVDCPRPKICGFGLSIVKYEYKLHETPLKNEEPKPMVVLLSRGKLTRNNLRKEFMAKENRKMQTILFTEKVQFTILF